MRERSRLKTVNHLCQKATSYMIDRVLNTPLNSSVKVLRGVATKRWCYHYYWYSQKNHKTTKKTLDWIIKIDKRNWHCRSCENREMGKLVLSFFFSEKHIFFICCFFVLQRYVPYWLVNLHWNFHVRCSCPLFRDTSNRLSWWYLLFWVRVPGIRYALFSMFTTHQTKYRKFLKLEFTIR